MTTQHTVDALTTTPAEAARELLVRRLVDGHGLDEAVARDAVDRYGCREDGPHQLLVHRAALGLHAELACAVMHELLRPLADDAP